MTCTGCVLSVMSVGRRWKFWDSRELEFALSVMLLCVELWIGGFIESPGLVYIAGLVQVVIEEFK